MGGRIARVGFDRLAAVRDGSRQVTLAECLQRGSVIARRAGRHPMCKLLYRDRLRCTRGTQPCRTKQQAGPSCTHLTVLSWNAERLNTVKRYLVPTTEWICTSTSVNELTAALKPSPAQCGDSSR